jgi:gamma-glutamyltranspeptidase/glutathione hydrolase
MMLKRLLLALALLTLGTASVTPAAEARQAARTERGAVSAADPRAVAAGVEMLRAGGSAADAAFATMLALTVVEPQSSGIGGGGFLLYQDQRRHRLSTYDGRETAPHAATPAYFLDANGRPRGFRDAVAGGMSVGVPGNVRLIEMAHRAHGRLPWARLFQPAIRLARDGFAITPRLYRALAAEGSLAGFSAWGRQYFYRADGSPKPVGTVLRNPELAALLTRIARRGPEAFYTGPDAEALVRTVRNASRNPSTMTRDDLATYEAKRRDPVCGSYRRYRICGMAPASSGGTTVLAILKQLERFNLRALGSDNPVAWHLIGESMRLAYADRDAYQGDSDFVRVPIAGLVDPAYLAARSLQISPDRSIPHVTAGTPPGTTRRMAGVEVPEAGTSHFVAVDRWGNVATYTSTIESVFGSGLTVNGFFLNNELTDFNFSPTTDGQPAANRIEGGKRPRSSMSPTLVYDADGRLLIAVGAAGGATIPVQTAKNLIAMLDFGMTPDKALALPVLFSPGDTIQIEQGSSLVALMPALRALGHAVAERPLPLKANAAERIGGRWIGAADPRSEGSWTVQ